MRKLSLLFLLFSSILWAQTTYNFTGGGDGTSWTDPLNWNPQSIPMSTGITSVNVTIPVGKTATISSSTSLTFTNGTLSGGGKIVNNGTLTIPSLNTYLYIAENLDFKNNGTFNLGDGANSNYYLYIVENAVFTNAASGTFNIDGRSFSYTSLGSGQFINNGTLVKKGENDKFIDPPFTNNGTINVQQNKLLLRYSNFLNTGTYNVSSGAELTLDNSGTHKFSGSFTGNIAGNFYIQGNTIVDDGETFTNNLSGNGLNFFTGTLKGAGTFVNATTFTIPSNNNYTYLSEDLKFQNTGTFNLGGETSSNYYLYLSGNAVLTNTSSGTFNVVGKNLSYTSLVNGEFINNGTLVKNGDFPKFIDPPFTNNGTISVLQNTLNLRYNNFLNSGTYNVSSGAELTLDNSGTHNFSGTFTGNIAGAFYLQGNIVVNSGVTFTNNLNGNGLNFWSGSLKGDGTFVNAKKFTIPSNNSSTYMEGNLKFKNTGTFNLGDGTSSNYYLYLKESAVLTNAPAGTFNIDGKNFSYTGLVSCEFINNGTLVKKGTNDKWIEPPFTNNGTINVQKNTLTLRNNNFLNAGTYNVSSGAELELDSGGNHKFSGTFTGNIDGAFNLHGNIIVDDGLTFTNNLSGSGMSFWNGTLKGAGTFVNASTFTIPSNNASAYLGENLKFQNTGTFNLGDGTNVNYYLYLSGNAILTNTATGIFNSNGRNLDRTGLVAGKIINYGQISKKLAINTYIDAPLENHGIIIAEEGTLYLSNQFNNASDGIIKGNHIKFNNAANFTNNGIFNPGMSPGKLIIEQFFSMDGGTLEFELNGLTAETEYDVLNYTGTPSADLSGDISVILGFEAAIGDAFTVFTSSSNIGATTLPATVSAFYNAYNYTFSVTINQKNIVLTVTDVSYSCPDLSSAPANVTFVDSECQDGCVVGGGVIYAPATACPAGSVMQYSTDEGANWSNTLPVYKQKKKMTIITRCSCEADDSVFSPSSAPVTTNPGNCDGCGNDSFTLTTKAAPKTAGTTSGDGSYASGTKVTATATANAGYKFVNWTLGGTEVSNKATYKFNISANTVLTANFEKLNFQITTKSAPAAGGTTTGAGSYAYNAKATLKAVANPGYKFVNWTIAGTEVSNKATYKHTVTGKATVVANFEALSYAITTKSAPAAGGTTTGAGSYAYNTKATLKAVANAGYTFVNWTVAGVEVSNKATYKHTVTGKATVVANFVSNVYAKENPNDEFSFNFYPNPVKDILYIKTNRNIEAVQAYNLSGQQVMNLKMTEVIRGEINVSRLPSGIYIFRTVLDNGKVESFRVMKK